MSIQLKDISDTLPNGILEDGYFVKDDAGLAVSMSGFYTVCELRAILIDLAYLDAKYQAKQGA